ncbi:MAG TPA: hypothetical protein VFC00_22695 [Micromonosporaceae bacterium]|nr:hypothetical protein [Micromonosporaceae bacterium]
MTESLKSLLEQQAAAVAFKPPDLDAIARDNHRRVLRRRAVTALACAAAVAVVAGTAVVLLAPAKRPPDVLAEPRATDGVTWAVGSTIHDGDRTIEVGHPVRALVPTSVGFVTIDGGNNVFSVTNRGVTQIGQAVAVPSDGTEYVRLFSDPRGTLAGWIGVGPSSLVMQVHDQATGQTRSYEIGGAAPPVFFAIDDRTAYWRNAPRDGVFAVDLDTGAERQLASGDQARNLEIWSVENGVLVFSRDRQPRGNLTSIRVGRSIDDAREFTFSENAEASHAVRLSPGGAWLTYLLYEFNGPPQHDDVRAFLAQVRDADTGDLIRLQLPQPSFAVPVVWLDETTLQFLVLGPQRANMYTCRVPEGSCDVAADLPAAAVEGSNLVLPTGGWIGE